MLSPSRATLPEQNILELSDRHWTVIDGLWNKEFIETLRSQAQNLYNQGQFRPAKIGAFHQSQQANSIRSDEICWIEPEGALAEALGRIKTQLNESFFLNLKDIECHFARYASGAAYSEHKDQSSQSLQGERVISLVLYLNPHWQKAHGGELQIREDDKLHCVEPIFGRLVLMRSDSVLHSVLASQHERWSLTGWYHRS